MISTWVAFRIDKLQFVYLAVELTANPGGQVAGRLLNVSFDTAQVAHVAFDQISKGLEGQTARLPDLSERSFHIFLRRIKMRITHFIEHHKNAQDALRNTHLLPTIQGMSMGSKIKQIRTGKGLTLAEVEARAGLADGNLSRIERGKQWVTEDKLLALATALEVPVYQLFMDTIDVDHVRPVSQFQDAPENLVSLTAEEHEWLKLKDHLGSDDITEFTEALRKRQERNIRLMEEMEKRPHPLLRRTSVEIVPVQDLAAKKQRSQSS